jgi:GntR family transcriptional regulator, transcriptional repressor for pyruvate dehydrogenase complex
MVCLPFTMLPMASNDDASRGGMFQPIRVERVSERVANQLKRVIADGIFKVGDRLPSERDLAEQMGVSRPSVREAIQQLEVLGMVETLHGGGSIVKNITEQQLRSPMEILLGDDRQRVLELTEVRSFMEAWAAREAATKRTPAEVERMRRYLREMEQDFEKGQIRFEVDFKFHTEIAAATHNTVFLHLIDSVYQLINYSIRIHREQIFVARTDQETILVHHQKVFRAIEAGDPQAAESAMKEHLTYVVKEFKVWSESTGQSDVASEG